MRIKDDTGCCGCLFMVIVGWMTVIVAVGGYKLFRYVLEL